MTTLVPLRLSHASVLARASKNPDFLRGLLYEKSLTKNEAIKDIRNMLARVRAKEMIVRSIEDHGEIIGRIGAGKRGKRWFLFYWIIPEKQGRGNGKAALRAFLPLAPRPLYVEINTWNTASKKLIRAHKSTKHSDIYRID